MSLYRNFLLMFITLFIANVVAQPAQENVNPNVNVNVNVNTEDRAFTVKGILGSVQVRRSPSYNKVRRERSLGANASVPVVAARDTAWFEARLNMTVREKDEIRTGPQSEVRLETDDGLSVKFGENTAAEVAILMYGVPGRNISRSQAAADRQAGVTATRIKVGAGSVTATVGKVLGNKSSVRFETPTATAAIRGTTLEIDVSGGEQTVVRVFDGVVQVAPAGTERFVEVGDGKMAEINKGQKAIVVKDVPKSYKRRSTRLKGEKAEKVKGEKPVKESKVDPQKGKGEDKADAAKSADVKKDAAKSVDTVKSAGKPADPSVKLTIDLGGAGDTIKCYVRDSITIEGAVLPAEARVSVNGISAVPDKDGVFKVTIAAPSDSGVFPLKVVAEDMELVETVVRTMTVGFVHTAAKVTAPKDGEAVSKPSVTVRGTAMPGSRVNVGGTALAVKRDGTFSGEVPLPDKEGNIKVRVEIVGKDGNAVWIERNIMYKKGK